MSPKNQKFAKLRGLIREKYFTESNFAQAIGIPHYVLSKCLNGLRQWRGEEIGVVCKALGIPLAEAYKYNFF